MAGWDAYITTLTSSSPGIKRAAIIGYPDGGVWARTEGANEFKVFLGVLCGFGSLNPNWQFFTVKD